MCDKVVCVTKIVSDKVVCVCVTKIVCDKAVCDKEGGRRRRPGTDPKTRTPHKDVGNEFFGYAYVNQCTAICFFPLLSSSKHSSNRLVNSPATDTNNRCLILC